MRLCLVVTLLLLGVSRSSLADVGFRLGPRIGLELHKDPDLITGADVRLSFTRSPLTINPTFDYYFDEDRTLYQVGVNALYSLPIPARVIDPYVGAGVGVNIFSYRAGVPTDDDQGTRVGLNLIGGVCLDLPVLSPFAQVMVSVGDIDLVAIGGGVLFDFVGDESSWDSCGRRR
jgi:hypothetical protein